MGTVANISPPHGDERREDGGHLLVTVAFDGVAGVVEDADEAKVLQIAGADLHREAGGEHRLDLILPVGCREAARQQQIQKSGGSSDRLTRSTTAVRTEQIRRPTERKLAKILDPARPGKGGGENSPEPGADGLEVEDLDDEIRHGAVGARRRVRQEVGHGARRHRLGSVHGSSFLSLSNRLPEEERKVGFAWIGGSVGGNLERRRRMKMRRAAKAARAYKADLGRKWREESGARGFARFLALPPRGSLLVSFRLPVWRSRARNLRSFGAGEGGGRGRRRPSG